MGRCPRVNQASTRGGKKINNERKIGKDEGETSNGEKAKPIKGIRRTRK